MESYGVNEGARGEGREVIGSQQGAVLLVRALYHVEAPWGQAASVTWRMLLVKGDSPSEVRVSPLLSGLLLTPTLEEGGGPGEREREGRGSEGTTALFLSQAAGQA